MAMSYHGDSELSSMAHAPTRMMRISLQGRTVLSRSFDSGCHFPSREQKDALLSEVQKTDPGYSLPKLNVWFTNRRRSFQEQRKEHKEGSEVATGTLLDPTSSLAREMWPSLSADTLNRLHNMLLEQPHLTVQHVELLANHFGVDKKHVEMFIVWRAASLQDCRVGQEQQRRPLPPSARDNDMMEVDEVDAQSDGQAHLPTPAGSISPEPVHRKAPAFFVHHPSIHPSAVDTSPGAIGRREISWPPSPISAISSHSQSRLLQGSSNPSQTQLDSCGRHSPTRNHLPSPPSHEQPSNSKPSQPSHTSPSDLPNVLPEQAGLSKLGLRQPVRGDAPETSLSALLPSLPPIPTPRTLRELDEAYAPTYARIERIMQNVERGKFAHLGLTPEVLKKKTGP